MKQTDIYTEALICLRSILQADHPEFKNWIDWLERDIQDWNQRREVAHHLRAYGGIRSHGDRFCPKPIIDRNMPCVQPFRPDTGDVEAVPMFVVLSQRC